MAEQLITFIDPDKFFPLVGYKINWPDFEPTLNNSKDLVYLKHHQTIPDVGEFDQTHATGCVAILVPDAFSHDDFDYQPAGSFKILFHNNQNSADKIDALKRSEYFQGELQSMEDRHGKPYVDLANAISLGNWTEAVPYILDQIPTFDRWLEAKLELLQALLDGQEAPPETVQLLSTIPHFTESLDGVIGVGAKQIFSNDFQIAFAKLQQVLDLD